MGNKIGRRRQVVDEKYTKPQGPYQHRDIDHKKLRKLILDSKLAPCYPGDDDCSHDLEECPICFLYYPSLNRSKCCMKGICTECFLQMKPPHSTRPTQCPFCKMSNYAVEYRGVKTKEEKGIEQVEEQKVIEAQIRMRQQELLAAEERMQKRQDLISSSSRIINAGEVEYEDVPSSTVPSLRYSAQGNEIVPSQSSFTVPLSWQPSHSRQNRDDNFDLDLEDIMVMEAIWLSIQEGSGPRYAASCSSEINPSSYPIEVSPSGGLACTVAALAERQHISDDSTSASKSDNTVPVFDTYRREERSSQSYPSQRWIKVSPGSGHALAGEEFEWSPEDPGSEVVAEAGLSYAPGCGHLNDGGPVNNVTGGHLIPESFEEQMMLAMAVSLAEARARTSQQGVTWM